MYPTCPRRIHLYRWAPGHEQGRTVQMYPPRQVGYISTVSCRVLHSLGPPHCRDVSNLLALDTSRQTGHRSRGREDCGDVSDLLDIGYISTVHVGHTSVCRDTRRFMEPWHAGSSGGVQGPSGEQSNSGLVALPLCSGMEEPSEYHGKQHCATAG